MAQNSLERMTLVADDARITKVFFPVFPPDQNPSDILAWIRKGKQ